MKISSFFLVPVALLCLSCARDPAPGGATGGLSDSGSPRTIERSSASAPPTFASPGERKRLPSHAAAQTTKANPALAATNIPPAAVMSSYLSLENADGSPSPSTIGRENHAAFVAEKRDVAWAEYVEARLREYLSKHRRASSYDLISMGCRSSMCEILAVSKFPRDASVDVDDWQDVIYAIAREPWYASSQIMEPENEIGMLEDGRVAFVTHLVRK